MLTLTPASQPRDQDRRPTIGLAIAGGGPLGAIYELGVLQAIDEAIDGVHVHDLDVYVGVSSGAFLSASLANRITASQMARVFMTSPDAEYDFHPETFLRPAFREYLSRAASVPGVLFDMLTELIRHPERLTSLESVEGLSRLIPTGIFDNVNIERFVAQALEKPGRSNDFRELQARLRIIAVELDTGQAVRFGEPGHDHVPISTAVQASAALPGLYPPVEIDGRYYVDGALRRTLHASVALEQGTDLLLAINPLVPFDAEGEHTDHTQPRDRMVRGGLPIVLSQTFRSLIQSRMQIGMRKYESDYPGASVMLVEPNRDDEKIFYTNVFSYRSRSDLAEHAYQTTRRELLEHADQLEAFLEPYRLGVNRTLLEREQTLSDSLQHEPVHFAPVGNTLDRTLDSLERTLRQP
ncbi:patatin-like phospholipase family protein [Wenzhouxiangella sp. AB-CW3]|uniref:patatin-like phospholipase family protein n=1 Tax=Wenzhouxiangella sp. AB-CW3 TaxID=2771012 RepID=UPI00168B6522|nr:patatin-like phospholipase family protein [Wenzhouxiangella sp. AB-CW3]QOC23819.1 patatin-like phospholipase family protein [Wenzhouxiangella sp. AB-CW3]